MYSAQWLNLLEEGTNNYFAANFLLYETAIVISGVKLILWIILGKQRGVLVSISLVWLISDLLGFINGYFPI